MAPRPALEQVREGSTAFRVPASDHQKGPKAKEGVPFYNPAMRLSRDLSVLVLRAVSAGAQEPWTVCDAMASLGARGLRLAHEVPGVRVLLNDANEDSVKLARENAHHLNLPNVEFRTGRLEPLLADGRWDWVDIDPYGTPAPYLDLAVAAVRHSGVLAVTATDKASLCGVYPDVCLRRYNARPLHGPLMWEVATRILLSAIARAAGRRDRSIRPLLAHSTQHYVRAYVRVLDGAGEADRQARGFGYAWVAPDLSRGIGPEPPADAASAGPLWAGPLGEATFVSTLPTTDPALRVLLDRLATDVEGPPLYYTVDELTRAWKRPAPRLAAILERLRADGSWANRTHFAPRGIKTTAAPEAFRRILGA